MRAKSLITLSKGSAWSIASKVDNDADVDVDADVDEAVVISRLEFLWWLLKNCAAIWAKVHFAPHCA